MSKSKNEDNLLWRCKSRVFDLSRRTLIMGIVNVTPDSFSDGGQHNQAEAAISHGLRLVDEGADILDIGGESTRPGAEPVSLEDELRRVLPVIQGLRAASAIPISPVSPISIDTSKAEVARQALATGAEVVNDVTALRGDPEMSSVVARSGAGVALMHMRGNPRTMQENPQYADVVGEIADFFQECMAAAEMAGIGRVQIVLDPGIGFGKTLEHNLEIIRRLPELTMLGRPILMGPSRKGFIGRLLGGLPPDQRVEGTAAAVTASILGGARIVRVHDVAAMARVARVADALRANAECGLRNAE